MSTIVCFEVHFLDLAHQRISWVSTGTLVIECILNHAVQSFQEVLLVNTVILDGLLDANSLFEIFDLLDEQFESFLVILAAYTAEVCTFCIASQSMWILILREGSHLNRNFFCVESQNIGNHQCICNAVWQVMICAQFVCHRMAYTQECVCKCHTCHCRKRLAIFSRAYWIICAVHRMQLGRYSKMLFMDFECQTIGVIGSHDGSVSLQSMGQCVDTGSAGQTSWAGSSCMSASTIAMFGMQLIVSQRVLYACRGSSVITANGVTSEPVPAEVGTATK